MTNRSNISLIDNITTAENLGNGIGVFKEKSTPNNLQFRTLSGGTNVILTNSGDTLTISSISDSMLNAVNGLYRTGADVGIGGTFTGDTEIDLNDNTFNISNLVPFNIGAGFSSGSVNAIAIQSDGKILVGGSFMNYSGNSYNNIIRLRSDGSIDENFIIGEGFGGSSYTIYSIVLQSDGKILVGGSFIDYDSTSRQGIARLNANGSLDLTFDTSSGFNSTVRTIVIQSDGKILVGGLFTIFNENVRQRIARLNNDGSLDTTFGSASGFNNAVYSIALQSDDKILVGGSFTNYSGITRQRIARLNTDGSHDTNYGGISGLDNTATSIILQSDNKLLVGGYFTSYSGISANYLTRLNSDGTKDITFDTSNGFNGFVSTSLLQSDNKILIGGGFTSYSGISANYLTRLNSDGTKDITFDTSNGFNAMIGSFNIQTDGKILVGGYFTSYSAQTYNRIIKLNLNGNIDNGTYHNVIYNGKVVNYDNNYHQFYTDHTLVDKEYVDDKFDSVEQTLTITADNGITKTIDNIQLGGPLIQSTNIIGSYPLTIKTSTLSLSGGTSMSLKGATINMTGSTTNVYGCNTLNFKGSTVSISGNTALLSTPSTGTISDRLLMWNTSDKCIKSYNSGNVLWRAITGVTSLGSGYGVLCSATSVHNLCMKSLSAGTNVTLSCNNNYVAISSITPPAGSNTYVQFNDSGSFGGTANLKFDKSNKILYTPKIYITGDTNQLRSKYSYFQSAVGTDANDDWRTYFDADRYYIQKRISGTYTSIQTPKELTQSGSTLTWDVSDGFNARVTLTANITTFNFTGAVAGDGGVLTAIQNGIGGWTLAMPTGHLKEGGALVLSTPAEAKDILGWYYDGTNYFWNIGKAFA